MAERKADSIGQHASIRYSEEVVVGNTVRKGTILPSASPEKELRLYHIRQARERTLRMNMRYVLFLTLVSFATVMICIYYLKLQALSVQLQEETVSLQTTLKELQMENDIVYNEIICGIDLEYIRDEAVNRLGMDYPSENQIVTYDSPSSDYVKQYDDIPDS